jgi:hypothetical protein
MEEKIYTIGLHTYKVNHDIKLKNKKRLNELMAKIPTVDNRNAPGLSFDETMELLTVITLPLDNGLTQDEILQDFGELPESIELEILADFFVTRARMMISGMSSSGNSLQN